MAHMMTRHCMYKKHTVENPLFVPVKFYGDDKTHKVEVNVAALRFGRLLKQRCLSENK